MRLTSLNSARRFGFVGAAHAGAGRIAALRHEAVDHAVEHHAVIEAFARQFLDAGDMARRLAGQQLDRHRRRYRA